MSKNVFSAPSATAKPANLKGRNSPAKPTPCLILSCAPPFPGSPPPQGLLESHLAEPRPASRTPSSGHLSAPSLSRQRKHCGWQFLLLSEPHIANPDLVNPHPVSSGRYVVALIDWANDSLTPSFVQSLFLLCASDLMWLAPAARIRGFFGSFGERLWRRSSSCGAPQHLLPLLCLLVCYRCYTKP